MTNSKQYKVLLSDQAKEDLHQIHRYILTNFYSRQSADSKVDLILSALKILKRFPESCPLISSRGYGDITNDGHSYRYMPIENYIAFYYIEQYDVHIARILMTKQDWVHILSK